MATNDDRWAELRADDVGDPCWRCGWPRPSWDRTGDNLGWTCKRCQAVLTANAIRAEEVTDDYSGNK